MSRDRGQQAEQIACHYLQQHGLQLIAQNYQCRRGEIDLIMGDAGTLVFVEVRARRSDRFGSALESITADKQSRIIATAQHYLQQNRLQQNCRFDVVAMRMPPATSHQNPEVSDWIRDAFQLC